MTSVSLFNEKAIVDIANSKNYKKTPFLFLIASLNRNKAMDWALDNFQFENKVIIGDWTVYKFNNI